MPMSASRPGSVDLLLDVRGHPRRAALEDALRAAVAGGRLSAGVRLPSSRVLAAELGLSRNTVADAYAQLVAEGWLVARQGSGTRVAAGGPAPVPVPRPVSSPRPSFDPTSGAPDVSAFPQAARSAGGGAGRACLGHRISAGLHALVPVPDEAAVIARAAERGLALHGLARFRAPGVPAADGLVIGYARPAHHAFAGALEALRSCWF
jgi:DNA-binding transcriptional MocR family regulator